MCSNARDANLSSLDVDKTNLLSRKTHQPINIYFLSKACVCVIIASRLD